MARFITIEGGDGSGKSTLIAAIQKTLTTQKIPHVLTREPGGTEVGDEIRETLMKEGRVLTPLAELFLYEAARTEHVSTFIKPALAQGTTVVCDRFTHSSLAYQGYARGLGAPLVKQLNELACQGLAPDLTIWLKVSPQVAQQRMKNRGALSGFDNAGDTFHEKIFHAFETIASQEPHGFLVLDAHQSPQEIADALFLSSQWKKLFS